MAKNGGAEQGQGASNLINDNLLRTRLISWGTLIDALDMGTGDQAWRDIDTLAWFRYARWC